MGSSVNTNFTENNNATQDVHSNVEHNITNTNHYNDHTEEGHLYKKDFIAGNFNNLDRVVNDGHQVFHLMNLVACEYDYNCYTMKPTITDDGQGVLHKLVTSNVDWNPDVQDQGKLTVADAKVTGIDFGKIVVTHALLI